MSDCLHFEQLPHSRGHLELEFVSSQHAILWLDNPSARNAMSIAMMHQFPEMIEILQERSPTVLVIRGRNGHFCAGGDLVDVKAHLLEDGLGAQMCEFMTYWTSKLRSLPIFIVTVLERAAIGGGAELLTVGDWVIASESGKVGFVQNRLGVTTGWGGGQRLIDRVGRQRAIQVLAQSLVYNASEAYRLGVVDELTTDVEASLLETVERLVKQPKQAFTTLMTWLHRSDERTTEQTAFADTWSKAEHRFALGLVDGVSKEK